MLYWNNKGKYQKAFDYLFKRVVPESGTSSYPLGEALRLINKVYYRNMNSGDSYSHCVEYRYVPPESTIIYVSHEWVGTNHPDPRGDQIYHLLLLLERLLRGDVSRTDMDAFHSLIYKHNYTTTAKDWKRILDPEKTFIFYDGFCIPFFF